MISVTPFWFFALIEVCVVLSLISAIAVWKWLSLRRRVTGVFDHWETTRRTIESAVSGLEMVRSDGGADVQIKLDFLALVGGVFSQDVAKGMAMWRNAIDQALKLFDRFRGKPPITAVPVPTPSSGEESASALPADSASPSLSTEEISDLEQTRFDGLTKTTPVSPNQYQDLVDLVGDQAQKLQELQEYKEAVLNLSNKLQRMTAANTKLLEYVRAFSAQDDKFLPLQQMLEKFQDRGAEIQKAAVDLQADHQQFEPKVTTLVLENQNMMKMLVQYRKQMDKVLDERAKLEETAKELQSKLDIRNKSYQRLHSKFEALRREYITLFELSGKAAQTRGPVSTSF